MWKLHSFSATQILREIKVGYLQAPKTTDLTVSEALDFDYDDFYAFFEG